MKKKEELDKKMIQLKEENEKLKLEIENAKIDMHKDDQLFHVQNELNDKTKKRDELRMRLKHEENTVRKLMESIENLKHHIKNQEKENIPVQHSKMKFVISYLLWGIIILFIVKYLFIDVVVKDFDY